MAKRVCAPARTRRCGVGASLIRSYVGSTPTAAARGSRGGALNPLRHGRKATPCNSASSTNISFRSRGPTATSYGEFGKGHYEDAALVGAGGVPRGV